MKKKKLYKYRKSFSYFEELFKKAFKLWLKKEPNNTEPVEVLINDFLSNYWFHELAKYEKIINNESVKRLFRNQVIPNVAIKLSKLKLPRILEISSNTPTYFIEGIVKSHILNKKEPDTQEIKKSIDLTITQYILIQNIGGFEIKCIDNPAPNDLKQIIEFHQIYNLKIDIELDKYTEQIINATNEIIEEIIKTSKNNLSNTPIIPKKLEHIIS